MAYEAWTVKNNTNHPICIGDLPLTPSVEPKNTLDLLRYYSSHEISQSM